jgi:two-component system, response regulator
LNNLRSQELLLVEDDENDIELALRALKGVNLLDKVHVVRDGQEALDYILGRGETLGNGGHSPLVVLLDLKLPKINGWEVLQKLKTDVRTASIPIVILTSSKEPKDLKRCYEMGANSYIVKPYDLEDFTKAVSTAGLYWLVINERAKGD